jgi:hypothetical protein
VYAKLAQDIISADTALAVAPADTDEFLVSDAGVLKRMDYSLIKASSDFVKIGSDSTTSTVAELKVEGFVDAAVYHKYLISFMNVIPETDAQDFAVQLLDSSNNAITGLDYERISQHAYMSTTGSPGDSHDPGHGTDRWDFATSNPHSSTASNMGGNGEMTLSINGTSWTHGVSISRTLATNNNYYAPISYIIYDGGTAPTGIRCLFDSGGIESGKLVVYGYKL